MPGHGLHAEGHSHLRHADVNVMPGAASWDRFAATFIITVALLVAGFLTIAYVLDPFDAGRSPFSLKPGVRPQGPRTAAASRGRDPAYDAAIFGNSHVQLLSPERLDALTGLSFVQLAINATGPKEQFAVIDWFMRHHPEARALVIGADRFWCEPELVGSDQAPFPFWIFSRSPLEYWRGLLRFRALEEIPRRVEYLLAERPARARADGYWDYEPTYVAGGYATNPARRADIERSSDDYISNITGEFAAARQLKQLVGTLPPATSVVLVFPPVYHTLLPSAGTKGASAARDCKAALTGALAGHPNAAVLDWRVDRAEVRRAEWFFDHSHYRHPVAELIEKDVAAALRQLPRAIP
jgi:hypothetical protein